MIWFDPAEFRSIYQAHASRLVLYARQWMGCEEAEDAVQDVFIRLAQQSAAPAAIVPWLYRSVRNAAISAARAGRRRRHREQQGGAERWFDSRPADLIDASDAESALETLPHDLCEIVVLRIWSQLTWAEVAELTGRPVSTVFDRYKEALSLLRSRMESRCPNQT